MKYPLFMITCLLFFAAAGQGVAAQSTQRRPDYASPLERVSIELNRLADIEDELVQSLTEVDGEIATITSECGRREPGAPDARLCNANLRVSYAKALSVRHEALVRLDAAKGGVLTAIDEAMSSFKNADEALLPIRERIDEVVEKLGETREEAIRLAVIIKYGGANVSVEEAFRRELGSLTERTAQNTRLMDNYRGIEAKVSEMGRGPLIDRLSAMKSAIEESFASLAAEREYIETVAQTSKYTNRLYEDYTWVEEAIGRYSELYAKFSESSPIMKRILENVSGRILEGPDFSVLSMPQLSGLESALPGQNTSSRFGSDPLEYWVKELEKEQN